MTAPGPGLPAKVLERATAVIVEARQEAGSAPRHWVFALWEAGLLVEAVPPVSVAERGGQETVDRVLVVLERWLALVGPRAEEYSLFKAGEVRQMVAEAAVELGLPGARGPVR